MEEINKNIDKEEKNFIKNRDWLFRLADKYTTLGEFEKDIKQKKEKLRTRMIKIMNKFELTEVSGTLFSIKCTEVKPNPKLAQKKLHEILKAKQLDHLWEECLYKPDPYPKLTVKRKKL